MGREKAHPFFKGKALGTRLVGHVRKLVMAVYKTGTGTRGRGHWDACVGNWGRETRELGTSSMGRKDEWDGDAGDAGTLMSVSLKSLFLCEMCYLWSILDSKAQNHFGYLMMLTQNISIYRSKRTDYCD